MNGSINLKWNNYSLTFLKTLRKFQNKESLCDSTITCNGKFYPVHRLVLSLCSEYFEDIFEKTPCKHPFLIIKDIEPSQLESLLNFMYQGEVQVTEKNLPNFIKAAEALKIKGLISDESYLTNPIHNGNNQPHGLNSNSAENEEPPRVFSNEKVSPLKTSKRSPVILDPIIPLKKLSGFVYDSILSNFHLPEPVIIKQENVLPVTNIKKSKKIKKRNRRKTVKCSRIITNVKKSSSQSKIVKPASIPLRKSPRSIQPIENYYLAEEIKMAFDYEDCVLNPSNSSNLCSIEQNNMSQIKISSYSGGNSEEFNALQNSNNIQIDESVAVKVELTEYSVDDDNVNFEPTECDQNAGSNTYNRLGAFAPVEGEESSDKNSCSTDTFNCTTFGDLLENMNESVSSDIKPSDEVENKCLQSVSSNVSDLLSTSKSDHVLEKKLISCKFCLYSAFSKHKFQKHMILSHNNESSLKKCQFCPYISVLRNNIAHEKAHFSRVSFKCKFCWYRSVRKRNLVAHERLHVAGAVNIKKTKKCVRSATESAKKLKSTKIVPSYKTIKASLFQCHFCPYESKYNSNVKTHERIHTKKIMKCQHCTFTAFFKTVMKKHELIHKSSHQIAKKNMYACHLCPYSSLRKNSVLRHLSCHFVKKAFKCTNCTYSTAGGSQIKMHELLHCKSESKKSH